MVVRFVSAERRTRTRDIGSRRFITNVNVPADLDDEMAGRLRVSKVRPCDLFGVSDRRDS
jgi:hypothetical protein